LSLTSEREAECIEQRLGEMRRSTQDRRLTTILIENVTATLTLLSEHEARLETPLARTQGSGCRQWPIRGAWGGKPAPGTWAAICCRRGSREYASRVGHL
jgi:hypothetical protein